MSDNTKLIAEAREQIRGQMSSMKVVRIRQLADALEAAEQRIAELDRSEANWWAASFAAVIEQAKATIGADCVDRHDVRNRYLTILASADTGAVLAERGRALLSRVANDMPLYIDAEACRFIREYAEREEPER